MMKIKGLLLLVALLAWVQGAFADDDVFEYQEGSNNTVISGLVWGANPESLTIPASVTRVKEGAFLYATNLGELIIDGGNPVFESGVFDEDVPLEILNLGSGMSTANILRLIKTIGKDNQLLQIDINGFTGEFDSDDWDETAMGDYLSDNVKVSFEHQAYIWADEEKCRALLPKAIISDFEKNHVFDIFVFKDLVTEVLFLFPKFEIQGNDYIYINRKWVQKNTLTKSA